MKERSPLIVRTLTVIGACLLIYFIGQPSGVEISAPAISAPSFDLGSGISLFVDAILGLVGLVLGVVGAVLGLVVGLIGVVVGAGFIVPLIIGIVIFKGMTGSLGCNRQARRQHRCRRGRKHRLRPPPAPKPGLHGFSRQTERL